MIHSFRCIWFWSIVSVSLCMCVSFSSHSWYGSVIKFVHLHAFSWIGRVLRKLDEKEEVEASGSKNSLQLVKCLMLWCSQAHAVDLFPFNVQIVSFMHFGKKNPFLRVRNGSCLCFLPLYFSKGDWKPNERSSCFSKTFFSSRITMFCY